MSDGEAWTRQVLEELQAGGYRPRAWLRFLRESFTRARDDRRRFPRAHRETVTLGVLGAGAWAALAVGWPLLALAGSAWWLLVMAMVDWHLGMLASDRGGRLERLGVANLLVLARAAIVPALVIVPPGLLAAMLVPVGLTDAVDGPLARRLGETSRLGAWLDGSVDACVLMAAAVGAARHGLLPWWAVGLVGARHGLQWGLLVLATFARAAPPHRASLVPARLPGLSVFCGLLLATIHQPHAAVILIVAGASGGLATVTASALRSRRLVSQ